MEKLRVLIVDDSVVYRSQIRAAVERIDWISVAGVASNGKFALQRLSESTVDVMILDLEMPEVDGLETLRRLKAEGRNCKVLIFSSVSKRGSEATLEALRLGASDFVTKPDGTSQGQDAAGLLRSMLEPKLEAIRDTMHARSAPISRVVKATGESPTYPPIIWDIFKPSLLVIGSSTGGPTALENLFSKLPAPYEVPIVICQHMPPIFTETFAQRLGKLAGVPAKEVQNGEELKVGTIYVAPGNYHVRLKKIDGKTMLSLDQGPLLNSVRPAVDPLFETAAEIYGSKLLSVVLTGMGADGKIGAIAVKSKGGAVVIQDKASSVVFGMPGAVHECGAFDRMGNLDEIVQLLTPKICALNLKTAAGT